VADSSRCKCCECELARCASAPGASSPTDICHRTHDKQCCCTLRSKSMWRRQQQARATTDQLWGGPLLLHAAQFRHQSQSVGCKGRPVCCMHGPTTYADAGCSTAILASTP
jgi:hypothetical protein